MIKLSGYILTVFFLTGVFFSASIPSTIAYLSLLSGHFAFALFAVLIARGARRTSNHFLYFTRLLATALATEIILIIAVKKIGIYIDTRNVLFTYAASLALIAGIAMAIGCYHDLVAHAVPAGGGLTKKELLGVPVNPGNYRIAPIQGLVIGLATAGLAVFVTIYFRFAYGLYGLLFVLLVFIAMRDDSLSSSVILKRSVYNNGKSFTRTISYVTALTVVFLSLTLLSGSLRALFSLNYLVAIPAILAAAGLPETPRPPTPFQRWLSYATLPIAIGFMSLIRFLL